MRGEDLGVIIADRGMMDDHMPTRVMDVLGAYHRQISTETSMVFTRERVSQERRSKMTGTIRDRIEQREMQMLRVVSDDGFDEPDGATEEAEGAGEPSDEGVISGRESGDASITIESDALDDVAIELERLGSDKEEAGASSNVENGSVSGPKDTVDT